MAQYSIGIDVITKQAKASIQGLTQDVNGLNAAAKQAAATMSNINVGKGAGAARSQLSGLGNFALGIFQGIGQGIAGVAADVAKAIGDTLTQIDTLNASLKVATGGGENYRKIGENVRYMSEQFGLARADVQAVAVQLGNFGFDNSAKGLTGLGNLIRAAGKDFKDLDGIAADVAQGDINKVSKKFEDVGIQFRQVGNNVIASFKGVDTNLGTNSQNIIKYLTDIGNTNYSGALDEFAKTISGTFARAREVFVSFVEQLSNSPIGEAFKNAFGNVDFIDGFRNALSGLLQLWNSMAPAVTQILGLFNDLLDLIGDLNTIFSEDITLLDILKAAYIGLAAVIEGAAAAFRIFVAYFKNGLVTIVELGKVVFDVFKEAFTAIPKLVTQAVDNVVAAFGDLVTAAVKIGTAFADAFARAIKGENPIKELQKELGDAFKNTTKPIDTGFLSALEKSATTAFNKIAASSEAANAKAKEVAGSYKGVAGAIDSATGSTSKLTKAAGDAGKAVTSAFGKVVDPAIQKALDQYTASLAAFARSLDVIGQKNITLDPVTKQIQDQAVQWVIASNGVKKYEDAIRDLERLRPQITRNQQQAASQTLLDQVYGTEEDLKNRIQLLKEPEGIIRNTAENFLRFAGTLKTDQLGVTPDQLERLTRYTASITTLQEQLNRLTIADNIKKGIRELNFDLQTAQIELDNFWATNKDGIVATEQAYRGFLKSFDPQGLGKNISAGQKEELRILAERQTAIQEQIKLNQQLQDTFQGLGSAISNWALNGKSAIKQVYAELLKLVILLAYRSLGFGTNSLAGSFTQGLISGISGRAGGGTVQKGRAYRTGENGPETVVMGGNGFVIPNSMIPTARSSGVSIQVNPVFNNNGTIFSQEDMQNYMQEWAGQIMEQNVELVNRQFTRNGLAYR